MTDAIELAQHILTLKNDEFPAQITGKQLKDICQALIQLNNKVDEYKIFMKHDASFINEYIDETKKAQRELAEMKQVLDAQRQELILKTNVVRPYQEENFALHNELAALKDKYRWRKQSEDPAPKGKIVLSFRKKGVICAYSIPDLGKDVENDAYWRFLDMPEIEDKYFERICD